MLKIKKLIAALVAVDTITGLLFLGCFGFSCSNLNSSNINYFMFESRSSLSLAIKFALKTLQKWI